MSSLTIYNTHIHTLLNWWQCLPMSLCSASFQQSCVSHHLRNHRTTLMLCALLVNVTDFSYLRLSSAEASSDWTSSAWDTGRGPRTLRLLWRRSVPLSQMLMRPPRPPESTCLAAHAERSSLYCPLYPTPDWSRCGRHSLKSWWWWLDERKLYYWHCVH